MRLLNTIFDSRKIKAKLMLNSKTTIFSHFFISLNNIVSNNLSFLPFCLMLKCIENCGLKRPPKRGPWAICHNIFKFIHIHFLRNQTKKITIEPNSYTAMLLYFLFDSTLSTCPKKKWKLKSNSRLPTLLYFEQDSISHSKIFRMVERTVSWLQDWFFLNSIFKNVIKFWENRMD